MFGKSAEAKLKAKLDKALRKERFADALKLYDELEKIEPDEPRWPHRKGDLLGRMDRRPAAISSYERAVDLYAKAGFVARAAAMAKVVLGLDPARSDVLERVDPEAARRLHRQERKSIVGDARAADGRMSMVHAAVPLKPAVDSDDDEIRFEDAPEADLDIELELGALELAKPETTPPPPMEGLEEISIPSLPAIELDEAPPIEPIEMAEPVQTAAPIEDATEDDDDDFFDLDLELEPEPARPDATELARMPSMPLFAEVPKEALTRLLTEADLIELDKGEALLRVGQPSDSLLVLVEGEVEVHIPGLKEGVIKLREGDIVGETCLLDEVERKADVVAATGVQALRIAKTLLDELVETHPEVGEVLLELLGRRLIENLLKTSPLFAAFDPGTRAELARMFEIRQAEADVVLIEAGKRSDGLYITLLGKLESDAAGTLGPGAMIGQLSLLTRAPAEATIKAETDVLLLRLPANKFTRLAALYPPVLAHLTDLAMSMGA